MTHHGPLCAHRTRQGLPGRDGVTDEVKLRKQRVVQGGRIFRVAGADRGGKSPQAVDANAAVLLQAQRGQREVRMRI